MSIRENLNTDVQPEQDKSIFPKLISNWIHLWELKKSICIWGSNQLARLSKQRLLQTKNGLCVIKDHPRKEWSSAQEDPPARMRRRVTTFGEQLKTDFKLQLNYVTHMQLAAPIPIYKSLFSLHLRNQTTTQLGSRESSWHDLWT